MVVLGVLVSENDTYSNNSAAAGGAAFFLSSEAVLHLTRASDNRASSSGGALEVSNSQLELLRSTLSDNNVPSGVGGGLMLRSQSSADVTESELLFNGAANGAGVAVQDASLIARRCTVGSNVASTSGGGLFVRSAARLELSNLDFNTEW